MNTGKILQSIKKKLSEIADSLLPQPEPRLAPVPVRKRTVRR